MREPLKRSGEMRIFGTAEPLSYGATMNGAVMTLARWHAESHQEALYFKASSQRPLKAGGSPSLQINTSRIILR